MRQVLAKFRKDLRSIMVTGRANTSFLDEVFINYFGMPTPITAVAHIAVANTHTVVITPFDKDISKEIERCMFSLGYESLVDERSVIRVKVPKAIKPRVMEGVHSRLSKQACDEIAIIVRVTINDISKLPEYAAVDLTEIRSALDRLAQKYIAEIERDSDHDDDDSGPALVKR